MDEWLELLRNTGGVGVNDTEVEVSQWKRTHDVAKTFVESPLDLKQVKVGLEANKVKGSLDIYEVERHNLECKYPPLPP